ncbi:TonB-dependent receptor domain-containing protein [Roseateles sp.]|uniref:TonB-dependent receptor n=1 Tax=Roseateles sp. TaxID=1971397 RepID=UPI003264CD21
MKSRLFCKTATALAVSVLATGLVYAQEAAKEEAAPRAKDDTVRLGTITVVGSGAKLGTGMMLNDDSVKGRSTITKAAMEKELGTGNVLQSIAQLPGVNTYSYDATGLFGGDVTIRGFSSDQIGFTVNGVPVNDSGGYAFYAQEMIDKENVCSASVAQGSPELESPHSGATGGSVSMITCDPTDQFRIRATQTLGGLNLNRSFVRVDSGRFMNNMAKVFLSYSHAEADKWKGVGKAKKDHIDAGFSLDLNEDNKILGSVLYNRMVNQNIFSVSLAQLAANGYSGYDYATTFRPITVPPKDNNSAQITPGVDTPQSPIYYGMALNPFKNVIASVSGSFKVAPDTYLKVQPYMWYGFGNGGWSEVGLSETGSNIVLTLPGATSSTTYSPLLGGAVDLNGDGDTKDLFRVARASVTKTSRPGITGELSTTMGSHYLKAGLWYERATHTQTQPAVRIGADGVPMDIWLQEGCIQRADKSCYEGRNTKTISTAYQVYLNDQITLLNDRAFLNLGLRLPTVKRDVYNYANESGNLPFTVNNTTGAYTAGAAGTRVFQDYNIKRSFSEVLPQLGARFNINSQQHVFLNIAKNFRAPPNFAYFGSYVGLVTKNGSTNMEPLVEVKAETSVMLDGGWRFQSKDVSISATVYNKSFKNRQVQATDPNTLQSTYINAGGTTGQGLELEIGSGVVNGFSAYGSLTLQKETMNEDLRVNATGYLPTAGKQFGKVPDKMASLSLQYEEGPIYLRARGKFTAAQYVDLMNQEAAPSYSTFDLDAGYKFANWGMLKNPQLRLNIANIGNKQFRNPSSIITNAASTTLNGSGANYNPSTEFYYLGAPRLTSLTFSVDFE